MGRQQTILGCVDYMGEFELRARSIKEATKGLEEEKIHDLIGF